jgi:hypothetical protein
MFAKCLQFPRSILCCGLLLGGIGLPGIVPVRADNPVQKLAKKVEKANKKSRRALRKAGKAGILVLEGVAEVGAVIGREILKTEIDFDCTDESQDRDSQSSKRNSSTPASPAVTAVPSAAPPAAAQTANVTHSAASESKSHPAKR